MGRYLALWEVDSSRVPVDGKEITAAWSLLLELVKQDLKSGIMKDWGEFVGETNGYSIHEGTEVEVGSGLTKYAPYVIFKLHAVASASQMGEILKKMPG
jgi:hypothetical protein